MKDFDARYEKKRTGWKLVAALICAAVLISGCQSPFDIETPAQMIEIDGESRLRYLAMTHDGVVLRVRVISQGDGRNDVPQADGDFWANAVRERMRLAGGYALLEEKEVRSANGREGIRLEFGRDQDRQTYRYWLTLFVTDEHIHVIEAGGREDRFQAAEESIEEALSSYRVRR